MIRKFATVPGSWVVLALILATILAGATTVHAQETPAQPPPTQPPPAQPAPTQQQPNSQQSASQEATLEEIGLGRKPKVKNWTNWSFNAGGGANLTNGTTAKFARGGGGALDGGVARNYSEYFGFRLDFQWDNLPLRDSALVLAQAPGATSHVYSLHLDPIINIPVNKTWGGYILGGPSYFYRSGKLDSSTAIPGTACNSFYGWWGSCFSGSLPLSGDFLKTHQNDHGENFGGGITYKIQPKMDLYVEFRYFHGKSGLNSTDLRPITIGVRW
jgi:hypothetical protein